MNAVEILKYAHLTVLQTLDGFPASVWDTPGASGTWSVKDIIAHLASDDFLVYAYYGHKREHSAQTAAFRDRLT